MTRYNDFRKRLAGPPILADGAMGTELYQRGVYVNRCYDELCLTQPDLVTAVHYDYLRSGAQIIETNSYGANRLKLTPHGLGELSEDISRRSAEIARLACEKAGREAFIAGSIGPLGRRLAPLGTLEISTARDVFEEQARGLIAGGVDLISVETMLDPVELIAAVEAIRGLSADVPIIASFTLSDWDHSVYGATIERMATELNRLDVDAVGFNCSIGPAKLLDAAIRLMELTSLPVSLQPNAGELEWVEGRLICKATPEYFAEYAKRMVLSGVKIVGGCCGSTPAHIKAMDGALRAISPDLSKIRVSTVAPPRVSEEVAPKIPTRDLSPLAAKLADGKFVVSVEMNPPRSPSTALIVEKAKILKAAAVDVVNIPDGPRASARLSAMVLAHIIKRDSGIGTILHYTCRDRNILGMQSDLLGAEALGLDNILCITGDPPKLGDYPMATAVFDVDAIGLLRIASNLNGGTDIVGNPIPKGTSLFLGCGANPGAVDLDLELDRLHRKVESGAQYIMTQPVFDVDLFSAFLDRFGRKDIPILVGILPLANYRNAEFFHNEVPGMQVPKWIRNKLKPIDDRDKAAATGIEIAAEALAACRSRSQGVYIMPPFGRVELALGVLEG